MPKLLDVKLYGIYIRCYCMYQSSCRSEYLPLYLKESLAISLPITILNHNHFSGQFVSHSLSSYYIQCLYVYAYINQYARAWVCMRCNLEDSIMNVYMFECTYACFYVVCRQVGRQVYVRARILTDTCRYLCVCVCMCKIHTYANYKTLTYTNPIT